MNAASRAESHSLTHSLTHSLALASHACAALSLEPMLCTWLCNGMHERCVVVSRSRHEQLHFSFHGLRQLLCFTKFASCKFARRGAWNALENVYE